MARKASLLIIFLTVFIDLVGFGIVLPMLPLYSKEFGASGLAAGGIVAAWNILSLWFTGYIASRRPRVVVRIPCIFGGHLKENDWCSKIRSNNIEQIWASENFRIFKI